jgi:hypothetical protein
MSDAEAEAPDPFPSRDCANDDQSKPAYDKSRDARMDDRNRIRE